jgi:hypothetical protein
MQFTLLFIICELTLIGYFTFHMYLPIVLLVIIAAIVRMVTI